MRIWQDCHSNLKSHTINRTSDSWTPPLDGCSAFDDENYWVCIDQIENLSSWICDSKILVLMRRRAMEAGIEQSLCQSLLLRKRTELNQSSYQCGWFRQHAGIHICTFFFLIILYTPGVWKWIDDCIASLHLPLIITLCLRQFRVITNRTMTHLSSRISNNDQVNITTCFQLYTHSCLFE